MWLKDMGKKGGERRGSGDGVHVKETERGGWKRHRECEKRQREGEVSKKNEGGEKGERQGRRETERGGR